MFFTCSKLNIIIKIHVRRIEISPSANDWECTCSTISLHRTGKDGAKRCTLGKCTKNCKQTYRDVWTNLQHVDYRCGTKTMPFKCVVRGCPHQSSKHKTLQCSSGIPSPSSKFLISTSLLLLFSFFLRSQFFPSGSFNSFLYHIYVYLNSSGQ